MTIAEQFARAAIPDRVTVMGKRLEHFCIGHNLLLQRLGNPYAAWVDRDEESESAGIGDLMEAVLVCSRPYHKAAERSMGSRDRMILKSWSLSYRIMGRQSRALARFASDAKFRQYVSVATTPPKIWQKQFDGRPASLPTCQLLRIVLKSKLHYSEREIMEAPLQLVLADFYGWAYHEGHCEMMNDDELAAIDQVACALRS